MGRVVILVGSMTQRRGSRKRKDRDGWLRTIMINIGSLDCDYM